MRIRCITNVGTISFLFLFLAGPGLVSDSVANWGQWRGPRGDGVAPGGAPPVTWSEENNIRWKVELPGSGHASPIVWEDQIFLLTAVPTGNVAEPEQAAEPPADEGQRGRGGRAGGGPVQEQEFKILSVDRKTGETQWETTILRAMSGEGFHGDNSYASSSPITDGKHVYAYLGSHGLYCYDLEGNLKWSKEFGPLQVRFGEGATPALFGDTIVVVRDHEGDSIILALDANTGEVRWEKPRDEGSGWATPLLVEHDGRAQAIVNGSTAVRSYDLATGDVIWSCGGQTRNAIPSPVLSDGVVYVMSGFRGSALYAIELGHEGDLAGTDAVKWTADRGTPYVPSPALTGGRLYFFQGNDTRLSCLDIKTGEVHYGQETLQGMNGAYASPVAANGKVYLFDKGGVGMVLEDGLELKILATNRLDDRITASPAIVGDELFVRGQRHLYCIAAAK